MKLRLLQRVSLEFTTPSTAARLAGSFVANGKNCLNAERSTQRENVTDWFLVPSLL